uniref:uncharacterized protein LOC122601168 n=1 Tax=Erigeron canadensis TaxID=72917 RepID=UPI001CB9B38E|nr:uncharacterized protein LOC122601168 [Erigeron canadensis]
MSTLNRNKQFRKAVMKFCNMLSMRYAKHLETSKNNSLGDGCRVIIQDQNAPQVVNHTKDFCMEERWDDFDDKDIKMLLDEVLKYKQIAKLEATKGARYISEYPHSDVGDDGHELDENNLGSSATPINVIKKDSGRRQASSRKRRQTSSRRSRRRLPKSYVMLMNQVQNSGMQAYKSVAVSNAIELFKLVFLSSAKGPEVPNMLVETLRRYSEQDLFSAFNYLRDKNFMMMGSGIAQFVLSQQFLHNISLSPFPVNTGKKAAKMVRWLQEKENDLLENGVDLSADLQCGDVLQLCVLMCSGEISMFPCLPDEGIGEVENLKKRKCDDNEIYFRKEKGFPGINLSLSSDIIPRVDVIALSRDENAVTSRSNLEYRSLPSELIEGISKSNADSELTWNAMTCYARHLASSAQELSSFSPNLFRTVHSAIQKAGDQGLSMEEISEIIGVHGMQLWESMPELLVEVLEAFGSALKVNAYDSIRIVESLYRSKYHLASVATYQHGLDFNTLESWQENHKDGGKDFVKQTCTDCIEGHTTTDEEHHRLTILNRLVEVPQPTSEVQRNDETKTYEEENVMPLRTDPKEKMFELDVGDSPSFKPILPWVNGDGTINDIVYKGLVHRVLGIVMQNPGILEEHVLSQMNVLNPQSCRKLLELMILESHIIVRKMYQTISSKAPAMLSRLLGCRYKKPKLVCREHLFANPRSVHHL